MRTTHNSHLRCRDAVAFGMSEYRLLQLAASCVVYERHGVAEAILRRARLYDLPLLPALPCKPISADKAKPASASAALTPAQSPCAAASSYPEVPFTCPARYSPETSFVSSVILSCVG